MAKKSEPVQPTVIAAPSRDRRGNLSAQIRQDLIAAAHAGQLCEGDILPSTRRAAGAWGVSRMVVATAYDLLRAESAIDMKHGSAPRWRYRPSPRVQPRHTTMPRLSCRGLAVAGRYFSSASVAPRAWLVPGLPDTTLFDRDAWARRLRRVARHNIGAAEGYAAIGGWSRLRAALAQRLRERRGLAVHSQQIIIVPGAQVALTLLVQVLTDPGDSVWIEDPCYPGARAALVGGGLALVPMTVDHEGACPPDGPPPKLIYLTPSNQYPLGIRLSRQRRERFTQLAATHGAIVVEDDYDSEFHWRGQDIPALGATSGAANVVTIGTVSKALIPGLRLAWMVVPEGLVEPMMRAQRNLGLLTNIHAQAALAEMLDSGEWNRHLRRITRVYAKREQALAGVLGRVFQRHTVLHLPDGGLQLTVRFHEPSCEAALQKALAQRGAMPAPLSSMCLTAGLAGLVMGFGRIDDRQLQQVAEAIAPYADA